MRILAVDASALFSLFWHAAQGTQQEFSEPYLRTIQAIRRHREGFDRVAVCCDSGPSFRRAIWPSYKANRPDRGEPYREQIRRTIEALGQDGCSVFRAPLHAGYSDDDGRALSLEADDVIGSLCAWAAEDDHEVVILSSDKDLCQLVGPGVWVRNLAKPDQPDMNAAAVEAKFQVPPERIPDMLALAGDKSDNYKPIEGVGDVRAVALIKAYGSALAVFNPDNLAAVHQVTGDALAKKIRETGSAPVAKCLQVATIVRDAEIDFSPLLDEPVFSGIEVPAAAETPPQKAGTALTTAAKPQALQVQTVRAEPAPQLYSAELPYWAAPDYLSTLHTMGKAFHVAGCFPNVGRPEQVMVVGMMAHERGIGLATAMQHAYFVNGKISWSGAYLALLAKRSGQCEELRIVKLDKEGCTIRLKRTGNPPREVSFTYKDAEDSGVTNRNSAVWKPYRQQMLYWSCLRTALRQEFPDIIAGHYMPDESGTAPEEVLVNSIRETA